MDVEADPAIELPPDVKIVLYRVAQEAFSNIAKHARATRAGVRVHATRDGATLVVTDDGRGFAPRDAPAGMGLHIMDERLQRVAGTLEVESRPARERPSAPRGR